MYAVFVEVNADESVIGQAREFLPQRAAQMARESALKADIGSPLKVAAAFPLSFSKPRTRLVPQLARCASVSLPPRTHRQVSP